MCLYEVDSLRIEKQKSSMIRFKNIGSIFRTLEFLFAVLFFAYSISRTSPYVSSALRFLGVFLRRFSALVVNHHFVFLLGNGIIVTLFVKFCQFACDNQTIANQEGTSEDEDYLICEAAVVSPYALDPVPAEKEIRCEAVEQRKEFSVVLKRELMEVNKYRRSQSSVLDRKKIQLRRSETEPRRNSVSESAPARRKLEVDDLSNEEFKKKVESIIEQHRRSLREESMFIVAA